MPVGCYGILISSSRDVTVTGSELYHNGAGIVVSRGGRGVLVRGNNVHDQDVIVQNTAPWTYFRDRPVNPCPEASFDTGLDLLALRALHVPSTLRTVAQIMSREADPHGRQILALHDVSSFSLRADRLTAFQLDGDYLGEREKIQFVAVPGALRAVC